MNESLSPSQAPSPIKAAIGPAVVFGFGAAVLMWAIGFVTHLPGVEAPQRLTLALLAAAQLGIGVLAGRRAARPVLVGALAGTITGLINLLVLIGALVSPDEPLASAWAFAGAYVIASAVVGAIAGMLGGRKRAAPSDNQDARFWLGRFAVIAVCSAVPVLLSGGIVTSVEAGLAVPDWPSSYGASMWLYPLSKMSGGIYYEHAHRLFGSLVGLTTIALMIFAFIAEPRKTIKLAAVGIFLLVSAQGLLGGLRVTEADAITGADIAAFASPADAPDEAPIDLAHSQDNAQSKGLALLHGVLGQITFTALCMLAAVMGTRWRAEDKPEPAHDSFLRLSCALLFAALLVQLLLGATTRHLQSSHAMMTHLAFAMIVLAVATIAGLRTTRYGREYKPLKLLGVHVFGIVGLQLVLGFGTMFAVLPYDRVGPEPTSAVILSTAHQATGAALLATAAVLWLWTRKIVVQGKPPSPLPETI